VFTDVSTIQQKPLQQAFADFGGPRSKLASTILVLQKNNRRSQKISLEAEIVTNRQFFRLE